MQAKRSNAFRTVVSEVSFIDAIELLQYWKREHLKGVETDAPPPRLSQCCTLHNIRRVICSFF